MELERVRNGDKIIGYIRRDRKHPFYSRDLLWWSGAVPEYQEVDAFTGLTSADGRKLFVHDIVRVHFAGVFSPSKNMRIAQLDHRFWLIELNTNSRRALTDKSIISMEFRSHTFLNTDRIFGVDPQ